MNLTKKLTSLVLCLSIILSFSACNTKNQSQEKKFDDYLQKLFVDEVSSDTLSLNFTVKNPEAMGIKEKEPSFGNFKAKDVAKDSREIEKEIKLLSSFDKKKLNEKQQLTYDVLMETLNQGKNNKGFEYYKSNFTPIGGFQTNIQTNLVEYNFYSKKEVDIYLKLLDKFNAYVKELIQFENDRAQKGFGTRDDVLEKVIVQCKEFIAPEENCLITVFNEKIETVEGLTQQQKTKYKKDNEKAIKEKIIPTYQYIIDELTKLKGKCKNQMGLCHFENGKKYYENLVKQKLGSKKNIDSLIKMIEKDISVQFSILPSLVTADSNLFLQMENAKAKVTKPEEIINDLKSKIADEFPKYPEVDLKILPIYKSIENENILGYCLNPAVDDKMNNKIRINETASKDNSLKLYTLMAHEGYPGHLYQMTYFNETKPYNIRTVLNYLGYMEGWATYVENKSFEYADLGNDKLTTLMQIDNLLNGAMVCRVDIGVNYEGWTIEETQKYLNLFGLNSREVAEDLYTLVIGDPAALLPYYVGYLEVKELENYARNELEDDFSIKEFHKAFLDCGPASFGIVRKQIEKYIQETKENKK